MTEDKKSPRGRTQLNVKLGEFHFHAAGSQMYVEMKWQEFKKLVEIMKEGPKKMKKTVWMVIVSVLMSNVAWAQTVESCATAQAHPKDYPHLKAACDKLEQEHRGIPLVEPPDPFRPPTPTSKNRSEKLMGYGGLFMVIGGAMIIGGGKTYHIFGDAYCVTDYSVDYGSCFNPTAAKIGMATLGAGILIFMIGNQNVAINPQISKSHAGAAVTVKWGGKR